MDATTNTRVYNAANQITNIGFVYDAAGNRTSDGGTVLGYDAVSAREHFLGLLGLGIANVCSMLYVDVTSPTAAAEQHG